MRSRLVIGAVSAVLVAGSLSLVPAGASAGGTGAPVGKSFEGDFFESIASDTSPSLRAMAAERRAPEVEEKDGQVRPELGTPDAGTGFQGDGAVQTSVTATPSISGTIANFEGVSNQDNFNTFGFRVNPPDPVGDVGPNHYVEMTNLLFSVFDKQGNVLLGPVDTGTLWAGFPVEDCTEPSGDPIVVYDQFADRWLLSQFTTRGQPFYYDCVAISATPDPTGAYYRYAFPTQEDGDTGLYNFPDYPKYSVWKDSYVLTTRDFGDAGSYGISAYALEKNKMVNGQAKARAVQFYLDSDDVPLNLIGDGLLPADVDGKTKPKTDAAIPIIGTQDDNGGYGATSDALNIWEMKVQWNSTPKASLKYAAQLPVASFDSAFPCGVVPGTLPPSSRDCLPQPGITNGSQYLDILSYRQRPTFRLAYRNLGTSESMVTSQSVEASPGVAGMRWYEIGRTNGQYSVKQQGTFAPDDGVHRWMGSVAQDRQGNTAMGYNVVNGVSVYPGIRYTGRLNSDPPGQMTLGEGTIVNGTGVQRTTNSRWGDYSSLNVDPVDDCTFWYVNEYYTAAGEASSPAGWQTRIGSFKLPGCSAT